MAKNPIEHRCKQMFAKMKIFAAYGGIINTFFRYTFSNSARNKFAPATAMLRKL